MSGKIAGKSRRNEHVINPLKNENVVNILLIIGGVVFYQIFLFAYLLALQTSEGFIFFDITYNFRLLASLALTFLVPGTISGTAAHILSGKIGRGIVIFFLTNILWFLWFKLYFPIFLKGIINYAYYR